MYTGPELVCPVKAREPNWLLSTTAVHLYNGTVMDIALVAASPDYMALMARLVTSPKPPPLSRWSKWRRSINKKLGRPSTPDVGTLAGMLVSLRDATLLTLASPLDRVAVSHPPIPGLTEYDLSDALEHASLRPWLSSRLPRPKIGWPPLPEAGMYPAHLTEGHAVFVAHKHGLCENYKNLFDCWDEEEQMPLEMVLVAGFTKGDLRAEVMMIEAPFDGFQRVMEKLVDLAAGLDGINKFKSEEAFWEHIRNQLEALVSRLPTGLTMVLLTGENATHPSFLRALRDAVGDGQGRNEEGRALVMDGEGGVINPAFASARGSAQYARWRQEAPIGCEEPKNCQDEQERCEEAKVEL